MAKESTNEEILRRVSLLLADVVDALAPLVEATQPQRSPLGSTIYPPEPKDVAKSLSESANALRAMYSTSTDDQ
jgi:hypothetical protein